MTRITNYCRLIGLAAILGVSNAAYAVCEFETEVLPPATAPDRVADLSGQGNVSCADIIGSDNLPMREVIEVVFTRDPQGKFSWELPEVDREYDNGFVTNTPDDILAFPQGNGSRCDFSYLRDNAVEGELLDIGGNVDTIDSIACTDDIVNNEEAPPPPEPDFVITSDACDIDLTTNTPDPDDPNATIDEGNFAYFTGSNLDGTIQAVCSADPSVGQNECVRGCPKFSDIDDLQNGTLGPCQPNDDGTIPLADPMTGERCTPCLTAAQAKADLDFPGFDTGIDSLGNPIKLCWEYTNRVGILSSNNVPSYKPHKPIRSQTTETDLFNACYQSTVTVNFFGREIVKTVTTCD